MSKEIVHSAVLVLTIILSFFMSKSYLAEYDLQISAFLFIILFICKKFVLQKNISSRLMESVVFTFVVLSIINTTGGATSQFFFLVFFLLFSLSLLLEPVVSVVMTISLITYFLLSMPQNQSLGNLIPVFSLAFLTPFALFLGQEYIENQKSKVKSQKLQQDTFLFLSLMLKNHIQTIKSALENFMGDSQLEEIKKSAKKMEKLIEEFERET